MYIFLFFKSLFRRNYVQNEMLKVRSDYESIFNEIEGQDSNEYISWPTHGDENLNSLAYPKFISKKSKENKSNEQNKLVKLNEEKNKSTNTFTKSSIEFQKGGNNLTDIDLNTEQIKYLDIENLKKMSKTELINLRESVSLEMLWIQQAIQSRLQVFKINFKFY